MRSPLLDCTHGQTLHDITALGQHTRSNDIERGMTLPPLDNTHGRRTCHHRLWAAHMIKQHRGGMPSPPLDNIHGLTTLGMACHHGPWKAHTVERRRALHAIIALGRQTRSNDVGRGMPSSSLGSTHDRTTGGVAYNYSTLTANTIERHRA